MREELLGKGSFALVYLINSRISRDKLEWRLSTGISKWLKNPNSMNKAQTMSSWSLGWGCQQPGCHYSYSKDSCASSSFRTSSLFLAWTWSPRVTGTSQPLNSRPDYEPLDYTGWCSITTSYTILTKVLLDGVVFHHEWDNLLHVQDLFLSFAPHVGWDSCGHSFLQTQSPSGGQVGLVGLWRHQPAVQDLGMSWYKIIRQSNTGQSNN